MAEHSAARVDNPEVRHEHTDVDLRRITYWGAGLTALVVLILAFLLWLFGLFSERETRQGRSPQGIPKSAPESRAPRLQLSPRADMAELRAAEDKILNNYGWIDKEKGVVRIPIERAMEITIQRGLPARQGRGDS